MQFVVHHRRTLQKKQLCHQIVHVPSESHPLSSGQPEGEEPLLMMMILIQRPMSVLLPLPLPLVMTMTMPILGALTEQ